MIIIKNNELLYGAEFRSVKDNLKENELNQTRYIIFDRPKLSYIIFLVLFFKIRLPFIMINYS